MGFCQEAYGTRFGRQFAPSAGRLQYCKVPYKLQDPVKDAETQGLVSAT